LCLLSYYNKDTHKRKPKKILAPPTSIATRIHTKNKKKTPKNYVSPILVATRKHKKIFI